MSEVIIREVPSVLANFMQELEHYIGHEAVFRLDQLDHKFDFTKPFQIFILCGTKKTAFEIYQSKQYSGTFDHGLLYDIKAKRWRIVSGTRNGDDRDYVTQIYEDVGDDGGNAKTHHLYGNSYWLYTTSEWYTQFMAELPT